MSDGAEVSRTLALAWGLAAAPQRGPKRELSLERIVEAAVSIADAEGLAAVTMQRVAQTFEFSTMALYRYVTTKDELHRLMLDTALGGDAFGRAGGDALGASAGAGAGAGAGADAVDAGTWREDLAGFLRELVEGYRRHPWALDIPLVPDIHLMPGQVAAADRGLRIMRSLPIAAEVKLGVLTLLSAFARGHAAVEREVLAGGVIGSETRALIREAVTLSRFPEVGLLVASGVYFGWDEVADSETGAAADVAAAAAEAAAADAGAILDFSSEVLLAGLAQFFEGAQDPSGTFSEEAPALSPQQAYEAAEGQLRAHIALRKRTQQRVRELEREEAALHRARDRAKEFAKAHAKLAGE